MPVILAERILKPELGLEKDLGPIAVLGISEDPAAQVFRLNDEYPETGNQNVVDLSGPAVEAKGEMVEKVIVGRREPTAQRPRQSRFTQILEEVAPAAGHKESEQKSYRDRDDE